MTALPLYPDQNADKMYCIFLDNTSQTFSIYSMKTSQQYRNYITCLDIIFSQCQKVKATRESFHPSDIYLIAHCFFFSYYLCLSFLLIIILFISIQDVTSHLCPRFAKSFWLSSPSLPLRRFPHYPSTLGHQVSVRQGKNDNLQIGQNHQQQAENINNGVNGTENLSWLEIP